MSLVIAAYCVNPRLAVDTNYAGRDFVVLIVSTQGHAVRKIKL